MEAGAPCGRIQRVHDVFQHVNLAGRRETRQGAAELKARMLARIQEASGMRAEIGPVLFPCS
jgi:hypothetical protein